MLHFWYQMHECCGQQNTTTERQQGHHDSVGGFQVPSIFSRQPMELPSQQQRCQTTDHGGTEEDDHGHPLGQYDTICVIFTLFMSQYHIQMFRRHFGTNAISNCGHQRSFYLKNKRASGMQKGRLSFYSVVWYQRFARAPSESDASVLCAAPAGGVVVRSTPAQTPALAAQP